VSSTWTIASVTLRRMIRGRALWVGAAIAILPIGYAALTANRRTQGVADPNSVFGFVQLVLAVLPALFVASAIGDDVEDRSITYVWSRPVPRWTVPVGKLVAAIPVIWALALAGWGLASLAGGRGLPSAGSVGAVVIVGAALAIVAATIATLAPRYGMALTVVYMLFFDLPLGVMPAAIRNLSITEHGRTLAGFHPDTTPSSAALGIAAITAIWASIGLWRIRRLEA